MKYSVVVGFIFLLTVASTGTMENDFFTKKLSNDRLPVKNSSQPFISLSPKRRDSRESLEKRNSDGPLTAEQKLAIVNARLNLK